jgi:hypothetical protein
MSSKSSGDDVDLMRSKPEWIGDSAPDSFTISASDLGRSIRRSRAWREQADIEEEEPGRRVLRPRGEDARRNSRASGDHNILHQDPEVVEEVAEEFPFLNAPVQDEAVVNQGMSTFDAVIPDLDGTVEEAHGSYESVIYATESPDGLEADRAVMEKESPGEWDIEVERALEGEDSSLDAGSMDFSYTKRYLGDRHNEHFNAVMDMAVGRGLPESEDTTPANERNGELLLDNHLKLNKPVDWDRVEKLEFEKRKEGDSLVYDIHVEYSPGERVEDAMRYAEESMYLEGFEELDSVQEHVDDSVLPVQGAAAFTPGGMYINGLAAFNRMLEAQTR